MTLSELQITNLRNILTARLTFHPRINLVSGQNGSGKTSFLEALYLLGNGHSFRTRDVATLISHNQQEMTVFAKSDDSRRVSIQKTVQMPVTARLDGQTCQARSELASF